MQKHLLFAALLSLPFALSGQADHDARILEYKGLKFPCQGSVTPKLLIRNDGNVTMSGCVVETWKNGVLVNTFDWQLAVPAAQGQTRQPVFPDVTGVEAEDELEFKIKTVNNIPDENAEGNEKLVAISDEHAATSDNTIEVRVTTDDAPGDLTWELRDAGGALIASGGPYTEANTTIIEEVDLGSGSCYEFKGTDSGRDVTSLAGMRLVASGNTLHTLSADDLAAGATKGVRTGAGVACTNLLEIALRTDGQPIGTDWRIIDVTNGAAVCSSAGSLSADADVVETCCLVDGCYRLEVTDASGDGIVGGGYVLRMVDGRRIIDNASNFLSGSFSGISGGQGFCLPIGTGRLIFSSCDKLDWLPNRYVVASADAAVSGQYGLANATSGYEFWFFDPNGSYSFRRFRSHATSDGYGSGATRACHFRVNGWTNSVLTPHLPEGLLLNARIRGRVAGVSQEFGPACRFKIDAALAACPQVKLQNDPANTADFSCGVTREFGGANRSANRLVAAPPQFTPTVASSSVRYQFRFRSGGGCVVRPPQTSPTIHLNWSNGAALTCGTSYQVDVRVSKDGGVTWCTGSASANGATNCADTAPWGVVCSVTIGGCAPSGMVAQRSVDEQRMGVFPNPVVDGRVSIVLEQAGDDRLVELQLVDVAGRIVSTKRTLLVAGASRVMVDFGAEHAAGLHFLRAAVGDRIFSEQVILAR
ncbi:MAG: hypothetical protein JNM62_09945 [Flavobacteriales bacterium]|nr:hypothetical protein [Flavobacteriales bacterium]